MSVARSLNKNAMKKKIAAILASLFLCVGVPSCSWDGDGWIHIPGVESPIVMGVKYELEPGLYLVVVTGDKGGVDIKFEGEGEYLKEIPGGYQITGPKTGLVYQVTTSPDGKVAIFIVGGNGKLQPYNPPRAEK